MIHVRTIPGLISSVFDDNIGLVVLEVSQRQEDDISLVNPDLQSGAWRKSSLSTPVCAEHRPFSSSFRGCALTASRHRSTGPLGVRFRAF